MMRFECFMGCKNRPLEEQPVVLFSRTVSGTSGSYPFCRLHFSTPTSFIITLSFPFFIIKGGKCRFQSPFVLQRN